PMRIVPRTRNGVWNPPMRGPAVNPKPANVSVMPKNKFLKVLLGRTFAAAKLQKQDLKFGTRLL
ncbi:hypothetical protein PMAYCL1PPCAC_00352, partial [Pristionchus mayeri]